MDEKLNHYRIYFTHKHTNKVFSWIRLAHDEQEVRRYTQAALNDEYYPVQPTILEIVPVYWHEASKQFMTIP